MKLGRQFLIFSVVLFFACEKSPEITARTSEAEDKIRRKVWSGAEREAARRVERKVGSVIGGIDVSELEGWTELPSAGRAVVADFIREASALDPEWLELQRAMDSANEPKQFVVALDRFTPALAEWLSRKSTAELELRMVDGLCCAEEYLLPKLQAKGPDLDAIVGKLGEVYERFSEDPEVRASLQKLISLVTAFQELRSKI